MKSQNLKSQTQPDVAGQHKGIFFLAARPEDFRVATSLLKFGCRVTLVAEDDVILLTITGKLRRQLMQTTFNSVPRFRQLEKIRSIAFAL